MLPDGSWYDHRFVLLLHFSGWIVLRPPSVVFLALLNYLLDVDSIRIESNSFHFPLDVTDEFIGNVNVSVVWISD